jgi:hypothetical protein
LWSNAVNMHDINSRHLDIKTIIMKIAEKIRSNKPRKYIHTVWRRAAAVPRLWASQSCALGISSPLCHSLQVHTIQLQHFAYSHVCYEAWTFLVSLTFCFNCMYAAVGLLQKKISWCFSRPLGRRRGILL